MQSEGSSSFSPLPILHPTAELDFCLITSARDMEQQEMHVPVPGGPNVPQNVARTVSPPVK